MERVFEESTPCIPGFFQSWKTGSNSTSSKSCRKKWKSIGPILGFEKFVVIIQSNIGQIGVRQRIWRVLFVLEVTQTTLLLA